jgi:hypothetical protein
LSLPAAITTTAWSVAIAVAPLVVLFAIVQVTLLKLPRRHVSDILIGTALAALGLLLFLLGMAIGFLPFGRVAGEALATVDQPLLFVTVGALLGFVTTWGEPAVRILGEQVERASSGSMRHAAVLVAVCIGVAVSTALGFLRIKYAIPLEWLIGPGYLLVVGLIWLGDPDFTAVAVDSGGVASGPLANTLLLALALGASAGMGGQDPLTDGLGFVALIALAPIISVLILGLLVRRKPRQRG